MKSLYYFFAYCVLLVLVSCSQPNHMSSQLESELRLLLSEQLSTQTYLPLADQTQLLDVRISEQTGEVTIMFSSDILPKTLDVQLEDFLDLMYMTSIVYLDNKLQAENLVIKHLFDGKPLEDYFAELNYQEQVPQVQNTVTSYSNQQGNRTQKVVIAAGHGIYYHFGFKDWRAQRDPSNGITEDFITPQLAGQLSTLLTQRSQATTYLTRAPLSDTSLHPESNQPWWKMAARYQLQRILPDNPEIWNSRPKATGGLRHRDQDIRSWPLYANYLGANTLITIHTNASKGAASGTRVFYDGSRPSATDSQALGKSVTCYMAELINSVEAYKDFPVTRNPFNTTDPNDPNAKPKGELKLANMPAIIVEVAFHTNPNDARALQDPNFQLAAMRGIEKGLRLFNQQKECQHFGIKNVSRPSGPHNTPIPIRVNYKGFPQFSVAALVEITQCPSGWNCSGGTITFDEEDAKYFAFTWRCNAPSDEPSATFGYNLTLTDNDGVKTETKASTVTCVPSNNTASELPNALSNSNEPSISLSR